MRLIHLTQGYVAFVDDDDYERVSKFRWHVVKLRKGENFYAYRRIPRKGKTQGALAMHSFIMGVTEGYIIDHIDHDGLNNRKENLRKVTSSENQWNRKKNKSSSSKFIGVYWREKNRKWESSIRVNGKSTFLGTFDREEDASDAYQEAKAELHVIKPKV